MNEEKISSVPCPRCGHVNEIPWRNGCPVKESNCERCQTRIVNDDWDEWIKNNKKVEGVKND